MAQQINILNDRSVRALRDTGTHGDGLGLYLQVGRTGARSWIYRDMIAGRRREMGLGSLYDVTLADARLARDAARKMVKSGRDPLTQRQGAAVTAQPRTDAGGVPDDAAAKRRPVPSLLDCWKAYVAAHEDGWRGAKTKDGWMRSIDKHAVAIRNLPVDEIDVEAVVSVLTPMWTTRSESAGKLRDRLERVLDFARVKGHRAGDNPATWKGNLVHILPPRPKLQRGHMRALPYQAIPDLMRRLDAKGGMAARALSFTILTIARESMTLDATWGEIHDDLWVLDAQRMKKRAFRQPLSSGALAILESIAPAERRSNALVFPGPFQGAAMSNSAMDKVLKDLGADGTPHGMRSSFRDWAGDETDFARETIEECLAHQVGDETERAYRRSDSLRKRRAVLEAWSAFCRREAA